MYSKNYSPELIQWDGMDRLDIYMCIAKLTTNINSLFSVLYEYEWVTSRPIGTTGNLHKPKYVYQY